MTVYALGALPGDAQLVTLKSALQDPVADVRWNAAVAWRVTAATKAYRSSGRCSIASMWSGR